MLDLDAGTPRTSLPAGQADGQEYILTRCESAPPQAQTVHVHILWQFLRIRGAFWAPEAMAQDPTTTYPTDTVVGVIPSVDPDLYKE